MKKFILGFISGAILFGAAGTFAADVWQSINVLPNTIKVIVDGKEVQADNFLYNDTTYLPIRAVSEALKMNVQYDNVTSTAIISNADTPEPTPAPTANPDLSQLPELPIEKREGKEYVSAIDVNDMLKTIGLDKYSIIGHAFYNNDDVLNPLMKDIPLYEVDLIPLDYYTSTLVPFINSLR